MDIKLFSDLFEIGLHPIPIGWNEHTRQADIYPEHRTDVQSGNGKHDLNDVKRWLAKISNANGIALKLHPPFFMYDFDLKNTDDKTIFESWLQIIEATSPDVVRKLCIEETRSGGYHVYAKHYAVSHKKTLASSEAGREVISIYTGGLLSFCSPTPGYTLKHNDFIDIDELTAEEFDLLTSAAVHFNKYEPKESEYTSGEHTEYPSEYESICLQFDKLCPDDVWESLLQRMELEPTNERTKEKFGITWHLYLRKGSVAKFSAKVSFAPKRVFLFSGSFTKFPTFHSRSNEQDKSWRLTPSRVLYYLNDKDWKTATDAILQYCPEITKPKPETLLQADKLPFPYDIFPEDIQQYITAQSIQHEYLAGATLAAIAATIGNSAVIEAMPGYTLKAILYMAIVAPPGASKSPALSKSFRPLEDHDSELYRQYEAAMEQYREQLKEYEKDKRNSEKPTPPAFPQIIIKDSTIEMVVKILTHNPMGCCVVADELVGFLNRMNQYKSGDEVQKWLELWSGGSVLLQRITREVNKVENSFCGIVGGIQPGVLESMSQEDNQHNGFYHRFLFVYPEPQPKVPWQQIYIPESIQYNYRRHFQTLLHGRSRPQRIYHLSDGANALYKAWFDHANGHYNKAITDHIKGIIAKYQDYCLRFALIIQVLEDRDMPTKIISTGSMDKAIRLTRYFFANMKKALKLLAPETPVDKLQSGWEKLHAKLQDAFSMKSAVQIGAEMGLKESAVKSFIIRNEKKLFEKVERGMYNKLY